MRSTNKSFYIELLTQVRKLGISHNHSAFFPSLFPCLTVCPTTNSSWCSTLGNDVSRSQSSELINLIIPVQMSSFDCVITDFWLYLCFLVGVRFWGRMGSNQAGIAIKQCQQVQLCMFPIFKSCWLDAKANNDTRRPASTCKTWNAKNCNIFTFYIQLVMQIQHKTDTGTNCTVANFHLLSNQAEKAAFTNTKFFGPGSRLVWVLHARHLHV